MARVQDIEVQSLQMGFSKTDNDQYQQRQSNLKMRQKLMRELYIVEQLVHIIFLPWSFGDFQLGKVTQNDVIVKLC